MTTTPGGAVALRFAGERLRQRRNELELSRRAVAIGAQLTTAAVKQMEQNRIRPSDAAFARLANVLGLTAEQARSRLLVAGPADHRPTEFASEATARPAHPARNGARRLVAMTRRGTRRERGDRV